MCKDNEAKDFLSWITDPQNASYEENILTDEELEKWDRLQIERPTAILSGERLHDALKAIGYLYIFNPNTQNSTSRPYYVNDFTQAFNKVQIVYFLFYLGRTRHSWKKKKLCKRLMRHCDQ